MRERGARYKVYKGKFHNPFPFIILCLVAYKCFGLIRTLKIIFFQQTCRNSIVPLTIELSIYICISKLSTPSLALYYNCAQNIKNNLQNIKLLLCILLFCCVKVVLSWEWSCFYRLQYPPFIITPQSLTI